VVWFLRDIRHADLGGGAAFSHHPHVLGAEDVRLLDEHHDHAGAVAGRGHADGDAIVEVKNIVRHLRMGKPPLQPTGTIEIGLAVVATTTLCAVFVRWRSWTSGPVLQALRLHGDDRRAVLAAGGANAPPMMA
jgi:hypothetical protein